MIGVGARVRMRLCDDLACKRCRRIWMQGLVVLRGLDLHHDHMTLTAY